MNPEVIFLRPLHGENRVIVAWQCLMVELGIHFAFDDRYQLPDRLPRSLDGVKLILIDEKSWDHYRKARQAKHVLVFKVKTPDPWSITDETVVRNPLELMAASAGLRLDHPAIRRRLQARPFRQLFGELRAFFLSQLKVYLERPNNKLWSEPFAFGFLQTMELFHEYEPNHGWLKLLDQQLDYLVTKRACDAPNLDYLPGMEVFIRAVRRTGDTRLLELARRRITQVVETYDRVADVPVLHPGRDHLVWCESLAMFAPSAVLLGVELREKRFIEVALQTARSVRKICCDPKTNLWYHGGRPGYHTPAFWGRGMGWALIGLTGILRNLPTSHRQRGLILGYLREAFEGLARVQDDEGLWHNVLDNPQSRSEFRCTCMFVWCFAEARRKGWLKGKRLDAMLHRGMRAIKGRMWRDRVCSVVWATGASATHQYYLSRPHINNGAPDALHAGVSYALAFGGD